MRRIVLASLTLCMVTACSTAQHTAVPVPDSLAKVQSTSFEIDYSLGGHGEHRLTGSSGTSQDPHVATLLEREVIEQGSVHQDKYDRFVSKVLAFAQKPQRTPSQECRSPFSIILKIDGKTYTSKGCRTGDDGGFARLVREGEFLLYSKK